MKGPTKKQREVLDYIRGENILGRPPPCVREIRDYLGLSSTRAVCDRLDALERKNCITRDPKKARSIRIVSEPNAKLRTAVDVPMLGYIPAGTPDRADEYVDGVLSIGIGTLGFEPSDRTFALVVHGDSMEGRGILDGDKVIVDGTRKPRNGDMVAALIDGECSLKTFVQDRQKVFLKPENPRYRNLAPIDELQIQGVARAVIRTLK